MKNRQRWTFGGVYPRGHSEGREDDPWVMRTDCLLSGHASARVDVRVRFLHVVERQATREGAAVGEVTVGGERHLSWQEAVEREAEAIGVAPGVPVRVPVAIPAGAEEEPLGDGAAIVRSWEGLEGELDVRVEARDESLLGVTAELRNTTPWSGGPREDALRRTFCSAHTVLTAHDGAWISLTDPPPELAAAAAACRNEGTWPVLVGDEGATGTLLSSPIILSDHPQVAPESPGDLFDGGEIDQMLVLNILTLTDEEKAEMRDSDPRTRKILERTEALTPDELMALHGTIREFGMVR
jgi:hydrogenase maturation protease